MIAKDREHRFNDMDEMLLYLQDVRSKILERRQQAPAHHEGIEVREIRSGDESSGVSRYFWLAGMDKLSLTAIGSLFLILAIIAVYSTAGQDGQIAQMQSAANMSTNASKIDNAIARDVEPLQAASENATDGQPVVDASPTELTTPTLSDLDKDRDHQRTAREALVLNPQQSTVSESRPERSGPESIDGEANQRSGPYTATIIDLSPDLNHTVSAETKREANTLVSLADKRLQQNRLTSPSDDSALHYYKQALSLDSGNADARYGLTKIATRFGELAEQQISRGNFTSAERYISAGLDIAPWDPRLKALNRRIKIERASRRAIGKIKGVFRSIKKEIENN
jgi:hypothetical protein